MSKLTVYHGTHKGFKASIEGGIVPADLRAGVRVRETWAEAVRDARAVSAFYFTEAGKEPVGLICEAIVDRSDCWTRKGILRVKKIRPAEVVKIHTPVRFPEFEPETGEIASGKVNIHSVRKAGRAIDQAYDDFMRLRDATAFNPARRI